MSDRLLARSADELLDHFGDTIFPDLAPQRFAVNLAPLKSAYIGHSMTTLGVEGAAQILFYVDECESTEFLHLLPAVLYTCLKNPDAPDLVRRIYQVGMMVMGVQAVTYLRELFSVCTTGLEDRRFVARSSACKTTMSSWMRRLRNLFSIYMLL